MMPLFASLSAPLCRRCGAEPDILPLYFRAARCFIFFDAASSYFDGLLFSSHAFRRCFIDAAVFAATFGAAPRATPPSAAVCRCPTPDAADAPRRH